MKVLIDIDDLYIGQCTTRSEWAFELDRAKSWSGFDRVFDTSDDKRAILYGNNHLIQESDGNDKAINYWEVILEP